MAELSTQELEDVVGTFVKKNLSTWLSQAELNPPISFQSSHMQERAFNLAERIVRVEEETKNLRKDMKEGFARMDKRFEEMQTQTDKRFEDLETRMDKRFLEMQTQMDKRFQDIQTQMDRRFEQVDKRFTSLQWFIGLGFLFLSTLISVLNFFLR